MENLKNKIKTLVEETEKTRRYSMSKLYGAFNEVFGTNEVPQACASCLIRKLQDLKKWLKNEKYVPEYLIKLKEIE